MSCPQGGEKLVIDCKADLLELFDEPCRGVRKKIKISYVARCMHVPTFIPSTAQNTRTPRVVSHIIATPLFSSPCFFHDPPHYSRRMLL